MESKDIQSFKNALQISIVYLIFGVLWIYFSDSAVELIASRDVRQITRLQMYKGWFFIGVTACLLFFLSYRILRKQFLEYKRRIFEQAMAQIKLEHHEALLNTIVNSSPDAIFAKDLEGNYLLFNTGAGHLVDASPEKVIGHTDAVLFSPEAADQVQEIDRSIIAGKRILNHEEKLTTAAGQEKIFWVTKGPLFTEEGEIFGLFGISRDITEYKMIQTRLEQQNALLNSLINSSPDAIVIKGVDKRYIVFNEAAAQYAGVPTDFAIGKTADEIFPPETAQIINKLDNELLEKKSFTEHEESMLMANGATYIYWVTKGLLTTDQGETFGIYGIYRDITKARENEQAIIDAKEHFDDMAHHDPLTKLPNRLSLVETLEIKTYQKEDHPFALFFLDLDGFKEINDSYGHRFGDELLILVTQLLRSIFPQDTFIARTGGDEFVMLLSCQKNKDEIHHIMQRLIDTLNHPFNIDETEVYITSSIGIAMYPGDTTNAEELLQKADAAMYNAKKMGKNTYSFYHPKFTENALQRTTVSTQLKKALHNNELKLYFQPQVDVHTGSIIGAEVLLRWPTPEGMISPSLFIPIAEESGLILEVGEFVLSKGCQIAAQWSKEGILHGRIAINVSARQLTHINFVTTLDRIIQETQCDPKQIELEITETSILENPNKMISLLTLIKAKGFNISIDDFGTGYSSLSYLKNLPIDKLKIDQSFVRNVTHEPKNQTIVKTIIALSKGLNMSVLAEGVETKDELEFLRQSGVDSIQGFYFYKPMLPEELERLLSR
ncbi:putative bifunctional diguanylate cyclase/phosphodiesterase [Sulfuricurvum sp.]|uniref:putative bifunctional diguanylate cyclase/phosphodiesterase n=1 Tax=Sulfuricurvum sp. TaxID=2025608 RepID=UPI003BAEC41C